MNTDKHTPLPLNDTAGLQGIAPTLGDITPLPWAATNCASHIAIHRQGWPRDAWQVASVGTQKQDAANAALIVRAVNSHAELVALARSVAAWDGPQYAASRALGGFAADARDIIAKLEGNP